MLVGPWEPLGARLEPTLTQRASEVSQKRSIQLPKSTIAYPQIHFKGGFQRYSTFRKKHVCPFAIHFFTPKNSHEGHLEAGATSLSQRLKVPRRLVGKPLQLQQQLRRKLEKLIRRTGQTDDGKTLFFFRFLGLVLGGWWILDVWKVSRVELFFVFVLVELKYFWPFVELGPSINDAWFQRYSTTDLIMLL